MSDDYIDADDDSHAAWHHQQEENRRLAEEEAARYRAANPLWDKCLNHPERQAVDPGAYDTRFCPECRADRLAAYADHKTRITFGHTYREVGAEQIGYNGETYRNQERI